MDSLNLAWAIWAVKQIMLLLLEKRSQAFLRFISKFAFLQVIG